MCPKRQVLPGAKLPLKRNPESLSKALDFFFREPLGPGIFWCAKWVRWGVPVAFVWLFFVFRGNQQETPFFRGRAKTQFRNFGCPIPKIRHSQVVCVCFFGMFCPDVVDWDMGGLPWLAVFQSVFVLEGLF